MDAWGWCHGTVVYIYNESHCHSATTGISFCMLCCVWLTQAAAVNRTPSGSLGLESMRQVNCYWRLSHSLRFLYIRFFVVFFALFNGRRAILSAILIEISRPGDSTNSFFLLRFYIFSANKLNYPTTISFIICYKACNF
jgi:hypothetical protein